MASNLTDHTSARTDKGRAGVGPGRPTNYTTETIRIEAPRESERSNLHLQAVGPLPGQGYQKKKTSSFQITSVTNTARTDGGEDSADDTEDTSENQDPKTNDLDQETPSFSEEYSKSEEVFFGPPPTIPTSSHYGIAALVQQSGTTGMMAAQLPKGVTVSLTPTGYELSKPDGENEDINNWENRFKIVKIDSNEPVKRGRWMCLDFMDSPAISASNGTKSDDQSNISNVTSTIKEEGNEPQTVIQMPVLTQTQTVVGQQHSMPMQYQGQVHSNQAQVPMVPSTQGTGNVPMQTQQPTIPNQSGVSYPNQVPSIPSGQPVQQTGYMGTSQAAVHQSTSNPVASQVQPTLLPPSSQSSMAPANMNSSELQVNNVPGLVQQNLMPTQNVVSQKVVTDSTQIQGTITNTNPQNIPPQGISTQQTMNMPQTGIPHGVINQTMASQVPQKTSGMVGQACLPNQTPHPQQQMPAPGNISTQNVPPNQQSNIAQSMPTAQQISNTQSIPSQQMQNVQMVNQANIGTTQQPQLVQTASTNQTVPPSTVAYSTQINTSGGPTPATTPAQPQTHMNITSGQHPTDGITQPNQPTQMQQSIPTSQLMGMPDGLTDTQVKEIAAAAVNMAQNETVIGESESVSSASTVAIDNKIEQAMDLVKSHLMFAVREEVEVLKEKIGELMERITQLEYENNVLRQYATQEALQQLQQHHSSNT